MSKKTPKLIFLVGADGAGKSYHARWLVNYIKNRGLKTRLIWSRFNNYSSLPLLAFTRLTGQESSIAIVISTLTIAALFTPLRKKLQSFIDQRFYRGKYDAEQTLAHFSEVARDEVEMDNLLTAMTSVVFEALKPEALK